jgi:DNA-directed RNA polymerase subunit RPC12/RpoP
MKKGWRKCHNCGQEAHLDSDQNKHVGYKVFIINEEDGKLTYLCQSCMDEVYDNIVEEYEPGDCCTIVRHI